MQTAQAVLVPMLLDRRRVDPATAQAVKDMMLMSPPTDFTVRSAPHHMSVRCIWGVCLQKTLCLLVGVGGGFFLCGDEKHC